MRKYKTYTVEIVIEEDSELHNRIQAVADAEGSKFEDVLRYSVVTGVYHHMNENLNLMEIGAKRRNAPM